MTFVETPIEEVPIQTMPDDPFLWSTDIPKPDTPYTYTGEGAQPSWSDVYTAAEGEYSGLTKPTGNATSDPFFRYAQNVGKVAIGEAIKATSSFINRVQEEAIRDLNLLDQVTDYRFTDIAGRINAVIRTVNGIADEVTAIVHFVLPLVRAELDKIEHDYPVAIEYGLALERDWVLHNVFAPLYAEILKVQPAINDSIAANNVTERARVAVGIDNRLAPILATQVAVKTALATLQNESDDCVKPMCQTMGPKTNLGKLLKGLNAAADIALFAELAGMDADELAAFLRTLIGKFGAVVGDFEDFFGGGGETLGQLIANATGTVL